MRVVLLDPADEPGGVGMAGNAGRFEQPDAIGKDLPREARGGDRPGSSQPLPDAGLRVEEALAYRARADAVYQRHDIDCAHGTVKEPERETVTFAMRRTEAEDRGRHLAGRGSQPTEKAQLAEAADSSASLVPSGSVPDGHGETRSESVISGNGSRGFRATAATDASLVHDDGPYCPVSELKGDEPATAERLIKSPEFTGENLRGFKDTDNPDFIDDYKRTYDAVAGPTAWANPRLNMDRMINQIQRHIFSKDGMDFTVLDLTGASGAQIEKVFNSLDEWASDPAMHPKSRLIILGGSY